MDLHRQTLRAGAVVIVSALLLRLWGTGFFQPAVRIMKHPRVQEFMLYLETGRVVRFSPSAEGESNFSGESAEPVFAQPEQPKPEFTPEDAALVQMKYSCSLRPDLEELLTRTLDWDLTGDEPTVLILHTHTTESYTKSGESYEESSAFRTLDENYNMISIGDRVADILSEHGISVLHDRTLHDYPSYNGSYTDARKSIQTYLAEYPSIRLVLDLHRDASGDLNNQIRPVASVEEGVSAQLMLVMGTNASGQSHPDWEENMALGLKLQVQLERIAPGITRAVSLRAQRFNQDMTPGSLLIEVGAAGNTHDEALLAAQYLAEAIVTLAKGSQ